MSILQGNYLRLERRGKTGRWWYVEYQPDGHRPVGDSGHGHRSRADAIIAGCIHLRSAETVIFDLDGGQVDHHEKYDMVRDRRVELVAAGEPTDQLPAVPPKRRIMADAGLFPATDPFDLGAAT